MKVAVINCSAGSYNLAAHKLADWRRTFGDDVYQFDGDPGMFAIGFDAVTLSCIFSWDAPIARDIALRVRGGSDVWAGGPGLFALWKWFENETGVGVVRMVDDRFDRQRGAYRFTFASRGCPVGCSFCIVPRLEGLEFTLDPDFVLAPVLCDNNLSALPIAYQEHIIGRYLASDVRLLDANSGFEPATLDEGTFARWEPLLRKSDAPWRFAFDELSEREAIENVARILAPVRARRKRVWVLVGNEPIAACYERALHVLEMGCEPYCQFLRPLNWLGDPRKLRVRHDWTFALGLAFCRYFNGRIWRTDPIWEYRPRKDGVAPFASLAPLRVA